MPNYKPLEQANPFIIRDLSKCILCGKCIRADHERVAGGAIVTPEADPLEPQLIKFEKKIEAGAEFIQTQAVYDLDKFKEFMDYARQFKVKILAGIILLTSAPMARFMNKNIAGVFVPQDLIDELASAPKGQAITKGIEIAGRMIKRIHEEKMCDGVHIMAIGKEELVPDIMAAAGIIEAN
jgi:5,10-methylenetetrahydrofolate reductase